MRKLYAFLAALITLLCVPQAQAVWHVSDVPTKAAGVEEGKIYLLKNVRRDKYLTNTGGFDTTPKQDYYWVAEKDGTDDVLGQTMWVFRNYVTGNYFDSKGAPQTTKATAIHIVINDANCAPKEANGVKYDFSVENGGANSVSFCTYIYSNGTTQFLRDIFGFTIQTGSDHDCPWDMYEAVLDNSPKQLLIDAIDDFDAKDYATAYTGGSNPFQYGVTEYDAMMSAYQAAVRGAAQTLGDEEYQSLKTSLEEAISAAASSLHGIDSGYYYVKTANSAWTSHEPQVGWYTADGGLKWGAIDTANIARSIFQIVKNEAGNYIFRNMGDASYVGGPETPNAASQTVQATSHADHALAVEVIRSGVVKMRESTNTSAQSYYHQDKSASGDMDKDVVTWEASDGVEASQWQFEQVLDEAIISALLAQLDAKQIDNEFLDLVTEGESLLSAAKSYKTVKENPLITDGAQLSSNASDSQEGQHIEWLIDEEEGAKHFWHSDWHNAVADPHYLQVETPEALPSNVQVYWRKRMDGNNESRPVKMAVSASVDGENWVSVDTLENPQAGFPTDANVTEFVSQPLAMPAGATVVRFTILATTTSLTGKGMSTAGWPWFCLSKFQLYGSVHDVLDETRSQYCRADMTPLCTALETAIATARETLRTGVVTDADRAALQSAIDAVKAAWADSAALSAAIGEATRALAQAQVWTEEPETGKYAQADVDNMSNALKAVTDRGPFYTYTQKQLDEMCKQLKTATQTFLNSVFSIDFSKDYYISSASTGAGTQDVSVGKGRVIKVSGYGAGVSATLGGLLEDERNDTRAMWHFVKVGERKYALQNVASGWYLAAVSRNWGATGLVVDSIAYEFVALGNGEMALRGADNGIMLFSWAQMGRLTGSDRAGDLCSGSGAAWNFIPVDDERAVDIRQYKHNHTYIVTLPYATDGVPYVDDDSGVEAKCYELTGADRDDQGRVKEIYFTLLPDETVIEAGTPFLMVLSGAKDWDGETVSVNTSWDCTRYTLTNTPLTANGMVGALRSVTLNEAGCGYISEDGKVMVTGGDLASVGIPAQSGWFTYDIADMNGKDRDFSLSVEGEGLLNGIRHALTGHKAGERVSVYTLDGVVLRKNVTRAAALQGLKKGIYLVGKEKIMVR